MSRFSKQRQKTRLFLTSDVLKAFSNYYVVLGSTDSLLSDGRCRELYGIDMVVKRVGCPVATCACDAEKSLFSRILASIDSSYSISITKGDEWELTKTEVFYDNASCNNRTLYTIVTHYSLRDVQQKSGRSAISE